MNEVDTRTEKRKLGDIGEKVACEYLRRRGFEILETNYLRKWGEIDIVAKKSGVLRFVEVKSIAQTLSQVSGETGIYRPEENMHPAKLQRLFRTIQTYMLEKSLDGAFQLDLITVKIDMKTREARAEILENIIA